MRKIVFVAALAAFALAGLGAQELSGVLDGKEGKVEYKVEGGDWKPAKNGDVVRAGTTISTGFKSSIRIKLSANTVVTVKPVTRLTLEELVKTDGGSQTKLFLASGRVNAKVNPEHTDIVDFKVRSTQATASVRGTSFEFDGFNLLLLEGKMDLRNNWNQYRRVLGHEYVYLATDNSVSIPIAASPLGLGDLTSIIDEAKMAEQAAAAVSKVSDKVGGSSTMIMELTIQ